MGQGTREFWRKKLGGNELRTSYGFLLALHVPDQTKTYSNDLLSQVRAAAVKLTQKMSKGQMRRRQRGPFLKHDKRLEYWALCWVWTGKKTKLNRKVIAVIGDEFKDISNRFSDTSIPLIRVRPTEHTQKKNAKIRRAIYLKGSEKKI